MGVYADVQYPVNSIQISSVIQEGYGTKGVTDSCQGYWTIQRTSKFQIHDPQKKVLPGLVGVVVLGGGRTGKGGGGAAPKLAL